MFGWLSPKHVKERVRSTSIDVGLDHFGEPADQLVLEGKEVLRQASSTRLRRVERGIGGP